MMTQDQLLTQFLEENPDMLDGHVQYMPLDGFEEPQLMLDPVAFKAYTLWLTKRMYNEVPTGTEEQIDAFLEQIPNDDA